MNYYPVGTAKQPLFGQSGRVALANYGDPAWKRHPSSVDCIDCAVNLAGLGCGSCMLGLGDVASDKASARAFIWSATQASRAKFQYQDRIADEDVDGIIAAIVGYTGVNNSTVTAAVTALFWTVLSPATQQQWHIKISDWKDVSGNKHTGIKGYRINADTLNAAGDALGEAINSFKLTGGGNFGTGVGTETPSGGLFSNKWLLAGVGVVVLGGIFYAYKKGLLKVK